MDRISNDIIEQRLSWRYATKQFDPSRSISPGDWHTLEEALVQSPSSFGLQPWRFIVVENKALRENLKKHSWNQAQVVQASHYVVLAAKIDLGAADVDALINCTATLRGKTPESFDQYRQMILGFLAQPSFSVDSWTTRQVYIALGMLLSTASMLGIDACPMEGFNPPEYDRELGLTGTGYASKVACALGYRSEQDAYATAPKVRFEKSSLIVRK